MEHLCTLVCCIEFTLCFLFKSCPLMLFWFIMTKLTSDRTSATQAVEDIKDSLIACPLDRYQKYLAYKQIFPWDNFWSPSV
jgi:hypothetical protein